VSDQIGDCKTLSISYELSASKDKVWDAWTKPEQFAEWWSPEHFTIPVCELDVKPEGAIRVDMRGPDGTIYPSTGTYKEVVQPDKLSFINSPLDQDGNKLFEVLQTVELSDNNGKTLLKITSEVISATPEAQPYLAGMEIGINQALNKLDDYLAKPA
jgi:uncharacterized protein YndB with AHSA1/START domain